MKHNSDEEPEGAERARELAVALQYTHNDRAPRVIASGAGEIAKRIVELARDHNVPIREDSTLAEILSQVKLGMEIPAETFKLVAEILAFLYKTDLEWRKQKAETIPGFGVQRSLESE